MVDCCSAPGLVTLEYAMDKLLGMVSSKQPIEIVNLEDALGRILAQDQSSTLNIPPEDNSAMDGYAVRFADAIEGAQLKMVAKVFAGHPLAQTIEPGECARIMTGGQVPTGCDAIIMQENTSAADDVITINQTVMEGEHIRRRGEDITVGQTVLVKGRRLTAADIGSLAGLGNQKISVYKKLSIALISTGDELKKPGETLEPGQFYESNGYTVNALLKRLDVNIINFGIIEDDIQKLTEVFSQADQQADIVITSGGVSVGEADYTKTVLEDLGEIAFWKLAIKPGKPFAFGMLPDSYFIGLPGNPVSAMVTLHQLAVPIIRKVSGENAKMPLRLAATTNLKIGKRPGRTDFQRGVYEVNEQGQLTVSPNGAQGSGILSSMSRANCYIVLEKDRGAVAAGESVIIEPFDELLS